MRQRERTWREYTGNMESEGTGVEKFHIEIHCIRRNGLASYKVYIRGECLCEVNTLELAQDVIANIRKQIL